MRETPTELLIRALESVQGATDVIIAFTKPVEGKDDDDVDIECLTNGMAVWKAIGMLECAKLSIYVDSNDPT